MKPTKDELSEMVGYEISPEIKRMILKQVRETGKDIRQIVSQFVLAPLITLQDDGTFWDNGKHYQTSKEWEQDSPLRPYSKLILIGTKETMEKHRNLESKEQKNK